ncbi:MAG: hypothetical protein MR890_10260 [Akkermansia muciniphila]|nr:hypothetical protein [Akkermansia muciniphila]
MKTAWMCLCLLPAAAATAAEERVQLQPREGVRLTLVAETCETEDEPAPAEGLCSYRGALWFGTRTCPPARVLTGAYLEVDGVNIPLDVAGLANPWNDPEEMTERSCRLQESEMEDGSRSYELSLGFFKGEPEDYLAVWRVFGGASLRTGVSYVGEHYPEWYSAEADIEAVCTDAVQTELRHRKAWQFRVSLKNKTGQPLRLAPPMQPGAGCGALSFYVLDPSGAELRFVYNGPASAAPAAEPRTLAPGKSVSCEVNLADGNWIWPRSLPLYAPYEVYAEYNCPTVDPDRHWGGRSVSFPALVEPKAGETPQECLQWAGKAANPAVQP